MNGCSHTTRGTSEVRSKASLQWQKTPVHQSSQGSLNFDHEERRREVPLGSNAALISRRAALSPANVAALTESTSVEIIERTSSRNKNRSGRCVLIWNSMADWFICTCVRVVCR